MCSVVRTSVTRQKVGNCSTISPLTINVSDTLYEISHNPDCRQLRDTTQLNCSILAETVGMTIQQNLEFQ